MLEFVTQSCHTLVGNPTPLIKSFLLFSAPNIADKKSIYDVPDNGSVDAILNCDANGFPSPTIQWMFNNVSLPAEKTYLVHSSDNTKSSLTVLSDRRLKVTSFNREGGFGVSVMCLTKNTEGFSNQTFLVRFLKGKSISYSITH